jgi:hypothetical protein
MDICRSSAPLDHLLARLAEEPKAPFCSPGNRSGSAPDSVKSLPNCVFPFCLFVAACAVLGTKKAIVAEPGIAFSYVEIDLLDVALSTRDESKGDFHK